jgi:hypothetical protein
MSDARQNSEDSKSKREFGLSPGARTDDGKFFCTFRRNEIPHAAFRRWAVGAYGRVAGCIVLSRDYFTRQVTTLLKFAKATTNPQLAAVLIEKAADLKSQVDEPTTPDATPQAPDVQPGTVAAARASVTDPAPASAVPNDDPCAR